MRGMRRRVPARIRFGQGRRSCLTATFQQVLEINQTRGEFGSLYQIRAQWAIQLLGERWNSQSPVIISQEI